MQLVCIWIKVKIKNHLAKLQQKSKQIKNLKIDVYSLIYC